MILVKQREGGFIPSAVGTGTGTTALGFCNRRERLSLTFEPNQEKWELMAKQQDEGQWVENSSEDTAG